MVKMGQAPIGASSSAARPRRRRHRGQHLGGHPRPRRTARVPHTAAPRLRPADARRARRDRAHGRLHRSPARLRATCSGCAPARSTSGAPSTTSRARWSCSTRTPSTDRTGDLIRSQLVRPHSHWPAARPRRLAGLAGAGRCSRPAPAATASDRNDLHQAALAHSLAALLVQLALVEPSGRHAGPPTTHEAFGWFRDHIEEHFHNWHKVSDVRGSTRLLDPHPQPARPSEHRTVRQGAHRRARRTGGQTAAQPRRRSVSEIAEHLGFDDASNFSSYFRRHTHMTPGTFRTRSRLGQGTSPAR